VTGRQLIRQLAELFQTHPELRDAQVILRTISPAYYTPAVGVTSEPNQGDPTGWRVLIHD
jgi:hypothetical protein